MVFLVGKSWLSSSGALEVFHPFCWIFKFECLREEFDASLGRFSDLGKSQDLPIGIPLYLLVSVLGWACDVVVCSSGRISDCEETHVYPGWWPGLCGKSLMMESWLF